MQFFRCQKNRPRGLPMRTNAAAESQKATTWEVCHVRDVGRAATQDGGWGRCRLPLSAEPRGQRIIGSRSPTLEPRDCRCRVPMRKRNKRPNGFPTPTVQLQQSNSRRAQADGGIEAFLFAAAVVSRPQAEKLTRSRSSSFALPTAAANAASGTPPAAASPSPPPPPWGRLQLRPHSHRCGGRRLLRVLRRARQRALQLRPRGADAGAPPRRAQRGRVRGVAMTNYYIRSV